MHIDPDQLRRLLEQADRPAGAGGPGYRRAAVFVLLVHRPEARLLLILRADRGDPWSNQMAFPGGHVDPNDAGALEAAYRETFEEVGIPRDAIVYLGELGRFETQSAKVDVRAFVGLWKGQGALQTDATEVTQVIELPLAALAAEHSRQGFDRRTVEQLGDRLVYPLTAPPIWGVTARIIHHFLSLVACP